MDDRDIEIEPYEEIVDRAEVFSTPSGSRSASPVSVDRSLPPAQSLSQGPSTSVYNANLMTSVMRPDPRYELALASQVPHIQTEHPDTSAVAVTRIAYPSVTWKPLYCANCTNTTTNSKLFTMPPKQHSHSPPLPLSHSHFFHPREMG